MAGFKISKIGNSPLNLEGTMPAIVEQMSPFLSEQPRGTPAVLVVRMFAWMVNVCMRIANLGAWI